MDRENFEFLSRLTKEQKIDLSKAVRDMVTRGPSLISRRALQEGRSLAGQSGRTGWRSGGADDDAAGRVRRGKPDRTGRLSARTGGDSQGVVRGGNQREGRRAAIIALKRSLDKAARRDKNLR